MTEITPGATPSPTQLTGVAQQKPESKESKPSDSSVKSFEQLLEGTDGEGTELPRGPFSRARQGGEGQAHDKQFQQGLAGQKPADSKHVPVQQTIDGRQPADSKYVPVHQTIDGRQPPAQTAAPNQSASLAGPPSGQITDGLRSDAAISPTSVPSAGADIAASQKLSSEGKKLPPEAGAIGLEVDVDEAISSLQQGAQAQSAAPTAGAVSLGGDARAEDVAKLANTFYKELGARDLNALKQGGALQFKLGGDAFPGTSVKVSVEAGLIVLDVSSIEPDVQQFLKDSQVELNRFFDSGVSVRVDERDEQSDQQQHQDEPEDQDENE